MSRNSFLAGVNDFVLDALDAVVWEIALTNSSNVAFLPLYTVALAEPSSSIVAGGASWPSIGTTQPLTNLNPVTIGPVAAAVTVNGFYLYGQVPGKAKRPIAETRFDAPIALGAGDNLVLPVGGIVLSVAGFDVDG